MSNMMILVFACFNALFLLVWFKSDAFVEWMNLFNLGKLIKYNEYQDERFSDPNITYPLFLKIKYGGFGNKLFGCPLCLSVWQSIVISFVIAAFTSFGPIEFLINYFINLSLLSISTIFIFGVISKLLNENK